MDETFNWLTVRVEIVRKGLQLSCLSFVMNLPNDLLYGGTRKLSVNNDVHHKHKNINYSEDEVEHT